jgi:hypothetical protein
MEYLIYCYTNKHNQKKYIGLTSRTIQQREKNHLSEAYNPNSDKYNTPFKQAIRKYGIENFEVSILDKAQDLIEANQKEKKYIKKYNSYCYGKNGWGYNATLGGDGCAKPLTPIVQLDKFTGELINTYDSISQAESILNIGHISECLYNNLPSTGDFCWLTEQEYLSKSPQELIDWLHITNHRIVQLDKNYNLIKIWNGPLEVKKVLGLSDALIVATYKGRRKSTGGFIWRTYKDYINKITPIYKPKVIYQYDKNKQLYKTYNTLKEAALILNVAPQILGRHLNSNKLYKEFYWERKEVE